MLSLEEALQLAARHALQTGVEYVSAEEALGRALAEDVSSTMDSPPFAKSGMDGYAVDGSAVSERAETLRVIASIAAGDDAGDIALRPECCARIMTGAMIPPGAARVIRREFVAERESEITILRPETGRNIIDRAAHVRAGDCVLTKRILCASDLAILTGLGIGRVPVRAIPSVAVLSSGSELLSPGEPLRPGMIYDTNAALLHGLLTEMRCPPVWLGHVGDDREEIRACLAAFFAGALGVGGARNTGSCYGNYNMKFPNNTTIPPQAIGADGDVQNYNMKFLNYTASPSTAASPIAAASPAPRLLITSGGVSKGDYDYIPDCLRELGFETILDGATVKPGKRFLFGRIHEHYVFALPGNPMAVYVLFHLFVRPFILRGMGISEHERVCAARLLADIRKTDPARTECIPVRLSSGLAEALPYAGSSHLEVLAEADGFVLLEAGAENLRAGEEVRVRLFRA